MSKRAERTDPDLPTGTSPSHPATADSSVKQETSSPPGARNKRRASGTGPSALTMSGPSSAAGGAGGGEEPSMNSPSTMGPPAKKSRTNTPWTPAEEQRLKTMRDAGNSWADIAKTFPSRTEGSVKKHWYKDMHYAEFAEDESQALLNAIKEYETNKWKEIGKKVGKPAKACEQYAKEHFAGKI
ncbi:putative Myb-like transcription factor-like protein [Acephala macrosclerotiorum]|nr:putative Myb-like transcription factor-like protein [Acephala macrosclerotiorum]